MSVLKWLLRVLNPVPMMSIYEQQQERKRAERIQAAGEWDFREESSKVSKVASQPLEETK